MEDVLTETPPPSRFHQDDLDNFAIPSAPIPSPFLVFSIPKPSKPLRPSTLIVALSSPSLRVLRRISAALIGSLVLPETLFSGTSLDSSAFRGDKFCDIYALDEEASVILVSVRIAVPSERAHSVAKALIGHGQIVPERVVIFDSVQCRNFRASGLSPDDIVAFRLETSAERKRGFDDELMIKKLRYLPSGSVVDGLGAALLGRCEAMRIRGTLCVAWPDSGGPAVSLVKSLVESVLPGLNLSSSCSADDGDGDTDEDRLFDSDMYT